MLDEEIEGTTDNFDIIEMDNQKHEYVLMPKITKVSRGTTKKRFINDESKRSSADTGGNHVVRGLEQQSLMDIQIDGELGEFIKVMRVLQDFPEVQSINIIQGSLKSFSDTKRFVYLSDGVTERRYMIAEITLFSQKVVSVIEVEREKRSLSSLICFFDNYRNRETMYLQILTNLINFQGNWNKEVLQFNNISFSTCRHGNNAPEQWASRLFSKFY